MVDDPSLWKLSLDRFVRSKASGPRNEKAARQIVKRYGPVLNLFKDVVFISDEEGYFIFVNKASEESNGVPAETFMGRHFLDIVDPKYHDSARTIFNKILIDAEDVPPVEMEKQTPSGQTIIKEVNWTVLSKSEAGTFFLCVSRDVTDRKLAQEEVRKARDELEIRVRQRTTELQHANDLLNEEIKERIRTEQKLRESEEKYRSLFENGGDAVFIVDIETGTILDANQQAEQLTGRSRQKIIGMHHLRLHTSQDAEYYTRKFQKHITGGRVFDLEAELLAKDGCIVPVFIYSSLIDLQGKKVIQCIFRDLSKEKIITDLKGELKAKKLVNRAKAVIAEYYKINDGDALKLLQRESRRQNRKLAEVAEAVISSRSILLN